MTQLPTSSRLAASRTLAPLTRFRISRSFYRHRDCIRLSALFAAGLLLAVFASIQQTIIIDRPMLQSVQEVPGRFGDLAWFFNVFLRHTGIPLLWAGTVVALLALRRNDYAALFVIAAAVGPFTTILKQTIDRPRPAGDFAILQFPSDPSFPSGHVMTAMAFFGLWFIISATLLPRWAAWPVRIACLATILLTGVSRVWVGAHWPTDVLGSLVWGSLFLVLVWMTQPLCSRLAPRKVARTAPV